MWDDVVTGIGCIPTHLCRVPEIGSRSTVTLGGIKQLLKLNE